MKVVGRDRYGVNFSFFPKWTKMDVKFLLMNILFWKCYRNALHRSAGAKDAPTAD